MKYNDYIQLRDEFIISFSASDKYKISFQSDVENDRLFEKCRVPVVKSGYYIDVESDLIKQKKSVSNEVSSIIEEIKKKLPSTIQIIDIQCEEKTDYIKEKGRNKLRHFIRYRVFFDDTIHLAIRILKSQK